MAATPLAWSTDRKPGICAAQIVRSDKEGEGGVIFWGFYPFVPPWGSRADSRPRAL
ncbi:MAG: hypothetical protein K0R41_3206 [Geminicoccaceae bacterium]|nr:hypothetical protein [Geminicoccaceae bacterium]